MYNSSKRCRGFSLKIHARANERFFGRTGIFKYNFECDAKFELVKSNIYENYGQHKVLADHLLPVSARYRCQFRMQLRWVNGDVCTVFDNDDYVSEVCREDIENVPFTFDCWKAHSEFVVYFRWDVRPLSYIEKITEANPGAEQLNSDSLYPDDRCSFRCSPQSCCSLGCSRPCKCCHLILSWFDRIDRMNFWKCLTGIDSETLSSRFQLIIFIQNYL
jgi:hypothetical protein